jgi:hypothetical protein
MIIHKTRSLLSVKQWILERNWKNLQIYLLMIIKRLLMLLNK